MSLRPKIRVSGGPELRRALVAAIGAAEFGLAFLFYARPQAAFALLGRPLLDPVISRQYGLFLFSVALFYGIISIDPVGYRRLLWIALAQRGAELGVAVLDWRAGALSLTSFALVAAIEGGVSALLLFCARGSGSPLTARAEQSPSDIWLARALIAFGALQLFWFFLSTIFVQLGARLLGWKLQDAYTTQQQGIALLVIGLTSLLTAGDVRRYRRFIWIPISSQVFGLANAVNELRLGTISVTIAAIQWSIEAVIIAMLLSLSSSEEEIERSGPIASPAKASM